MRPATVARDPSRRRLPSFFAHPPSHHVAAVVADVRSFAARRDITARHEVEQVLVETLNDYLPRVHTAARRQALARYFAEHTRLLLAKPSAEDDEPCSDCDAIGFLRTVLYEALYARCCRQLRLV